MKLGAQIVVSAAWAECFFFFALSLSQTRLRVRSWVLTSKRRIRKVKTDSTDTTGVRRQTGSIAENNTPWVTPGHREWGFRQFCSLLHSDSCCFSTGRAMIVLRSIALSNNFQEDWMTPSSRALLTPSVCVVSGSPRQRQGETAVSAVPSARC